MKTNATLEENNQVSLTKQAASLHGKELTQIEAERHAAKILRCIAGADEDDDYGQDFWTAAKEYFLN